MIYDNNTPKLMSLLALLRERLNTHLPDVLAHLDQRDLSLVAAFSPIFLTLYIYHLPLPVSTRFFESFLFEGETVLLRILFKMLHHKRSKILSMTRDDGGQELLRYLRADIVMECIDELNMEQLLDTW
jgi:Rab-GTPase-TBC domain